jgi:hypothetical protein
MTVHTDSETYTDLKIRRELAVQEGVPEVAAQLDVKLAELERLVKEGRGDGTLVLSQPNDPVKPQARKRLVPSGQLQLLAALDQAGALADTLATLEPWFLCELLHLAIADYRAVS